MKKLIILLIALAAIFQNQVQAQTQDSLWKTIPTKEYGIFFSQGILSKNVFTDKYGKSYFDPQHDNMKEIGFRYSCHISPKLKLSTGISIFKVENQINIKFDTNNLIGVGGYFPSSTYESQIWWSFSTRYLGVNIPFNLEYRLTDPQKRHQLWLSGGFDFTMLSGYNLGFDDFTTEQGKTISIANINFHYVDNMHIGLNFGLNYSFLLSPSHQINIGLKAKYNLSNVITGTYRFMPNDLQNMATGVISNKLNYLGLSAGYTFNNRRHLYKKKHRPDYSAYTQEPFNNSHEFLFTIPYLGSSAFSFGNPFLTPKGIMPGTLSRLDLTFRKYINQNLAWYMGLGVGYDKVYFSSPYGTLGPMKDFNISASFGFSYKHMISRRWAFEAGMDFYVASNLIDPTGTTTYWYDDLNSQNHVFTTSTFDNFHMFSIGVHAFAGFSYELKNRDRLLFSLDYRNNLTPTVDLHYTYNPYPSNGFLRYFQKSLNFSISYIFANKKAKSQKLLKEPY